MKLVAGRRLRDGADPRLGVAQQQLPQRAVRLHRLPQEARLHPQRAARKLHHGRLGRRIVAEDGRDAVHPLPAGHAGLDRGAVFHRRDHRDQPRDGEIGILGRVQGLGEDECDRLKVRLKVFDTCRLRCVEKAISGLLRSVRDHVAPPRSGRRGMRSSRAASAPATSDSPSLARSMSAWPSVA